MKTLLTIFVLLLSSSVLAEDISDFEIEGMSIGDSLLQYYSEEDINKNFEGISVIDYRKDEGYVTPVEAAGEDKVYVSRIREDSTLDNGLNIWVVADNLIPSSNIFFVSLTILSSSLVVPLSRKVSM